MDGIVLFNPAYRGAIPAPGRRRTAPDGRNHGEPGAHAGFGERRRETDRQHAGTAPRADSTTGWSIADGPCRWDRGS